ncbi:hypothetical protein Syun_011240 [Stephania yunnanensis]|uniref:Uncharacterized protein n=1 Tax=Stephania yunnanensis TaxID=152371 RepID=A0AAP0JZE6_9MAGN
MSEKIFKLATAVRSKVAKATTSATVTSFESTTGGGWVLVMVGGALGGPAEGPAGGPAGGALEVVCAIGLGGLEVDED